MVAFLALELPFLSELGFSDVLLLYVIAWFFLGFGSLDAAVVTELDPAPSFEHSRKEPPPHLGHSGCLE